MGVRNMLVDTNEERKIVLVSSNEKDEKQKNIENMDSNKKNI